MGNGKDEEEWKELETFGRTHRDRGINKEGQRGRERGTMKDRDRQRERREGKK